MSISKTLPMKFKSMHYALLAFITQSDEFTPELKVRLIAKLPVFDSVENQMIFYEKMVNFKIVEKDIVKPMMKKKKQEESDATKPVKEKKPRAPSKKTVAVAGPATVSVAEEIPVAVASTPEAPAPASTPAPASAPPVAEKPKKKRVVKKKAEQPITIPEQMEEKVQEEMSLTDEMKEEPYQPVTLKAPLPTLLPAMKKTKDKPSSAAAATKKKETMKAVTKKVTTAVKKTMVVDTTPIPAVEEEEVEQEDQEEQEDLEIENWLIIRDGKRYWTTDEFEKNGEVYEYCIDSEGDGCAGNVAIGCLKDGRLFLN